MIKELSDLTKEQREDHAKRTGTFNDFPPNWREITETEFAQSRHFAFVPVLAEYRQMIRRGPKEKDESRRNLPAAVSATLFWQSNGTGYSIISDFWKGTVSFYSFGEIPEGFEEQFDSTD